MSWTPVVNQAKPNDFDFQGIKNSGFETEVEQNKNADVVLDGVTTLSIGSVSTVPHGGSPSVVNVGTKTHAILNFTLVEGPPGESADLKLGNGLKWEGEKLAVDTANDINQNNALPITAAAVYATVGNIGELLSTI